MRSAGEVAVRTVGTDEADQSVPPDEDVNATCLPPPFAIQTTATSAPLAPIAG
jgi:hypothetical protein